MTYDYTVNLSIPIKIVNIPPGKVLKYPIPKTLFLVIKGNGWYITTVYLSGNSDLTINGSDLNTDQVLYTDALITKNIKLPSSITVLDIFPDSINLSMDDSFTKKIRIKPAIKINFLDGYGQTGDIRVTPDSIRIEGTKSYVDRINEWETKQLTLNQINKPVNIKLPLCDPPEYLMKFEPKEVEININVKPYAEKSYAGINIEVNYLPPNREVIFIPPKMDIVIRGSIEKLSSVTNDSLKAYVDYAKLIADSTGYTIPELWVPTGMKVIKTYPDRVQFVIRKRLL